MWVKSLAGTDEFSIIIQQRMLSEYTGLTNAAKKKALKGQKKFYYVFFVGTRYDSRGRGE
jgi:hypothetical protein